MGNRKAREYKQRQESNEGWSRVQTSVRQIFEDVCVRGIGVRRIQVVFSPSFEPGFSWDVREIQGEFRLFRSEVVPESSARKLVGYTEMKIDAVVLRSFFERLRRIAIPIEPDYSGCGGFDGTHFELALEGDLSSQVRFQWWSEFPAGWHELVIITQEMIDMFSKLERCPETPEM